MAQGFNIEIIGLPQMRGMIKGLVRELETKIENEIHASGVQIRNKAIRNITRQKIVDQGALRAGMQLTNILNGVQVFNSVLYSPFVEFGTKGRTRVPAEWQSYAMIFKGPTNRGDFEHFVLNLVDWMKRKGIKPKNGYTSDRAYRNAAEWIAIHILKNGLEARPFMYPAYKEEADRLPGRLLKLIMSEMKVL